MPSRGLAISGYLPAFSKGALIYGANIQSGVVTSAHLKDLTVVAGEIGAGAVTSAKLGTKAVTNAKMNAAFLSGTLVSGQTTRTIAHGLAAKPKSVVVIPLLTLAQGISARVPTISVAAASAATSTNIYVIGSQATNAALKYIAYVQI